MKIIKAARIVTLITGLVIAGMFFSSPVSAQDISGTWHGKLSIPTGSLTIVFHISQTGQGTYVTTLDSPDQGANGIKTQTTSCLLYTSPSPRDLSTSRMPSSA